ncbi:hypothetical protein KI387_003127, partial [Taxus chinensis]
GKGYTKTHVVEWDVCCKPKVLGGLRLKDLKNQGITLASKGIVRALTRDEPWKVLL